MILIGHPFLRYEPFFSATSIESIDRSKSGSTALIRFSDDTVALCDFCRENDVPFACIIETVREAVLAEALRARYLIVEKSIAPEIQKVAENYMFDSKILCKIENESEIEWSALNHIDGIIFRHLLD